MVAPSLVIKTRPLGSWIYEREGLAICDLHDLGGKFQTILGGAFKLTILSIPRGPREVRTTSATAEGKLDMGWLVTSGGDDVGGADVLALFRVEVGGLRLTCLTHLNK